MACFLAILLSADVRGWILKIKSHQYGDLVVRGCPRPPGSPTSCGKAVVRGRFGFLLGFDLFLVTQSIATCIFSAPLQRCILELWKNQKNQTTKLCHCCSGEKDTKADKNNQKPKIQIKTSETYKEVINKLWISYVGIMLTYL